MPGKGVQSRPSKKGRSTRSSSALLPLKDKTKSAVAKNKRTMKGAGGGGGGSGPGVRVDGQQKNRDVDQRELIDAQEQAIRHEMVRKIQLNDENPQPLVKPKTAAPKELDKKGTELAKALDDLQWT